MKLSIAFSIVFCLLPLACLSSAMDYLSPFLVFPIAPTELLEIVEQVEATAQTELFQVIAKKFLDGPWTKEITSINVADFEKTLNDFELQFIETMRRLFEQALNITLTQQMFADKQIQRILTYETYELLNFS